MSELYEICREKKENAVPRMANQDLADAIGKSQNTVAQYLRGEAPNASFDTVVAICRALNVSVDENSGIEPTVSKLDMEREALQLMIDELREKLSKAEASNSALQANISSMGAHMETLKRSLKMHRLVTIILLSLLSFALVALVIDVLNPNVGWIRTAYSSITSFVRVKNIL